MQGKTYLGVYSIRAKDAAARKRLFFVWSDSEGGYLVQVLDGAYRPMGPIRTVEYTLFQSQFVYEPTILVVPLRGGEEEQEDGTQEEISLSHSDVAPGTPHKHRLTPEEQANAEEVENYLRSHFNKAVSRLKNPTERTAALEAIKTVTDVEEGIVAEHKHMFADFGATLRKNALYDLALSCSKRALELAPDDDHAHFNTARIFYDMGNLDDAEQHLLAALELAPDAIVCIKMLKFIQKQRRMREKPRKIPAQPGKSTGKTSSRNTARRI